MNTQEMDEAVREADQRWNTREEDNVPVRDSLFDFID